MIWWAAPALAAAAYYLLVLIAALALARRSHGRGPKRAGTAPPDLHPQTRSTGATRKFYEAIRSHAAQDYPEFEILFGLSDPDDPAPHDIARLQARVSAACRSRPYVVATDGAECQGRGAGRTGATRATSAAAGERQRHRRRARLSARRHGAARRPSRRAGHLPLPRRGGVARHRAPRRSASPPSSRPACWSRGCSASRSSRWAPRWCSAPSRCARSAASRPSPITSPTITSSGGTSASSDSALSSRRWWSRRISAPSPGRQTWRHQLRWSRTIRVSRRSGYYGYVVTHATLWALVAFAARQWWAGALALGLRMTAGVIVGRGILRDRRVVARLLADSVSRPVRLRGLARRTVRRSRFSGAANGLTLHSDGRHRRLSSTELFTECVESQQHE